MTPEEIAATLTLPESVRARLATVDGPGFSVIVSEGCTEVGIWPSPAFAATAETEPFAWCPADSAAILWLAAEMANPCIADAEPALVRSRSRPGDWLARLTSSLHIEPLQGFGATAREACLRLLGEVTT